MKTEQSSAAVEPATKLLKVIDFSNRILYVGIDVHKTSWQVAVFFKGVVLSNVGIAASSEMLIAYLRKHYGDAFFHCVYECGARVLRYAGSYGLPVSNVLLSILPIFLVQTKTPK